MSSRTNRNPGTSAEEKPDNTAETSGTVSCFWSSTDPDWYDDVAGGDAA